MKTLTNLMARVLKMETLTNLKARVLIKFYDANAPLNLQMQVFHGVDTLLDANANFFFMMQMLFLDVNASFSWYICSFRCKCEFFLYDANVLLDANASFFIVQMLF